MGAIRGLLPSVELSKIKMKKTAILFIRQDLFSVENAIMVSFETTSASSGEAVFIAAIEQWLEAEGKGLDVEVSFNTGDLLCFAGGEMPNLLVKYSVHDLAFQNFDNCKSLKDYDLNFKTSNKNYHENS